MMKKFVDTVLQDNFVGRAMDYCAAIFRGQPEVERRGAPFVQGRLSAQPELDSRERPTSKSFLVDARTLDEVMDLIMSKLDFRSFVVLSATCTKFRAIEYGLRSHAFELLSDLNPHAKSIEGEKSWSSFLSEFKHRAKFNVLIEDGPITEEKIKGLANLFSIWEGKIIYEEENLKKVMLCVPVVYLSRRFNESQQSLFWSSVKTNNMRQLCLDFSSIVLNAEDNVHVKKSFFEKKIPLGQFDTLQFFDNRVLHKELLSIIGFVVASQRQSLLRLYFEMSDMSLSEMTRELVSVQTNEGSSDESKGFRSVRTLILNNSVMGCDQQCKVEDCIENWGRLFPELEHFCLVERYDALQTLKEPGEKYRCWPDGTLFAVAKAWGSSLKSLVFSGCKGSGNKNFLDGFDRLACFSSLESLVLIGTNFSQPPFFVGGPFAASVEISLPDSLKSLTIMNGQISEKYFKYFCSSLEKVTVCGFQSGWPRRMGNIVEILRELKDDGKVTPKELCFDVTFFYRDQQALMQVEFSDKDAELQLGFLQSQLKKLNIQTKVTFLSSDYLFYDLGISPILDLDISPILSL